MQYKTPGEMPIQAAKLLKVTSGIPESGLWPGAQSLQQELHHQEHPISPRGGNP